MFEKDKKLKIAISGFGQFANKRIMPALLKCSNIELVSIVESTMSDSESLFKIKKFKSLDQLLEKQNVDAVYIATPNHLHYSQSIQCLYSNVHVICEKPMALNSKECEEMISVAESQKSQLTIGHMLRYSPGIKKLKSSVKIIGNPISFNILFDYELSEKRMWALEKEKSGGGALIDAGIHCIDTIRYIFGDPVSVLEVQMDSSKSKFAERKIYCKLDLAGLKGSINVCSNRKYKSVITIVGDAGLITLEGFASCWDKVRLKFESINNTNLNWVKFIDVSATYSKQLMNFANTVLLDNINYISATDAMTNIKLVENIYNFERHGNI
jgi:predicted dehydrogenase